MEHGTSRRFSHHACLSIFGTATHLCNSRNNTKTPLNGLAPFPTRSAPMKSDWRDSTTYEARKEEAATTPRLPRPATPVGSDASRWMASLYAPAPPLAQAADGWEARNQGSLSCRVVEAKDVGNGA